MNWICVYEMSWVMGVVMKDDCDFINIENIVL